MSNMEQEDLEQKYMDYIYRLQAAEGGTVDDMCEREPFEEWVKGQPEL